MPCNCGKIMTVDEELHEMHQCEPGTCGCKQIGHLDWTPEEDAGMRLRKFVCTECTISSAKTGKEVVAVCTINTHCDNEDPMQVVGNICVLSGIRGANWKECNHA